MHGAGAAVGLSPPHPPTRTAARSCCAGLALLHVVAGHGAVAAGLGCPGDLNDDGVVTVNELVAAVHTSLAGCEPGGPCPGDGNGDGAVTIDELIAGVNAALDGCPGAPSPTPTPGAGACPYTLHDDTSAAGAACAFRGRFSEASECPHDLEVLIIGTGARLVATLTTDPPVSFGCVPNSSTTADLVAYFVGDTVDGQPIGGVLRLADGGQTLILEPVPPPPFEIGGPGCTFGRYVGRFTEVIATAP